MSDRIYACLLHLYPPRFRKEYEQEMLQLYHDRLRDETGFFRRLRLCFDLLADVVVGLPRAYRTSAADPAEVSLAHDANGVPSFRALEKEPLLPQSIFAGTTLAFVVMALFALVMTRPIPHRPFTRAGEPKSPIESVLEKLNQPTIPEPVDHTAQGAPQAVSRSVSEQPPAQVAIASPAHVTTAAATPARSPAAPPIPASQGKSIAASVVPLAAPLPAFAHSATRHSSVEHRQNPIPSAQPQPVNAFAAMSQLFQSHDIVMLGEVHDGKQEYEWLSKLVNTPGFAGQVDDIVVEFGNARYQQTVDRYIASENVPFEEVQKSWRNMVASVEPVSPVYGWLDKAVREANLQHRGSHQIRLLMGSPPADWDQIKTSADLAPFEAEREQWYATVVKTEVLAKHHRALLIMGTGHFLRGHDQALQDELAMQQQRAVPAVDRTRLEPGYIERTLRADGANPYLVVFGTNAIDSRGDVDRRFDSWPVPVIVSLAGNWVGALPAQPVITGGHASAIPLSLADQADALLYLAPCSALQTVHESRAELDGTPYGREITRRDFILVGQPIDFQYGEVPQCSQPALPSR